MYRWHLVALSLVLIAVALVAGRRPETTSAAEPTTAEPSSSPTVSILTPALPPASRSAPLGLKGVKACQANLKRVATALEMYATDHAGHYPSELTELLPTYLDSIPVCPAAGEETYSKGFAAGAKAEGNVHDWPDFYRVVCAGSHHTDAKLSANSPAFDLAAGLTPELPFEGTPGEARQACEGNLKNLGTAIEMYATDHQGQYPASIKEITPNYLRAVPKCPAYGKDSYSTNYKRTVDPDNGATMFSVRCTGPHKGTKPSTGPVYDSVRGLH